MRLLESREGRERSGGGATMSVVVHAALIAAAVIGTARSNDAGPDTREVLIPLPPYIYEAPPPDRTPKAPSGPARTDRVPGPGRTVSPPVDVPDGLPPIDVDVAMPIDGRTEVTIGGPASRGDVSGGFGSAPSYGAPDGSGVRDARTVEIPVVPDRRNPSPAYPEPLRAGGIEGRVVAEFVVDSTGRVRPGSLVIVESTHEPFATSVRRTVPALRFTPARVQGRPVAQRVRVPFEFAIR